MIARFRLVINVSGESFYLNEEDLLALPHFSKSYRMSRLRRDLSGSCELLIKRNHDLEEALRSRHRCPHVVIQEVHGEGVTPLWQGSLSSIQVLPCGLKLSGSLDYPGSTRPLLRRAMDIPAYRDLSPFIFLPRLYGEESYILPPLFTSESADLAEDLEGSESTICLTHPVLWESPGRVQIRDEVIVFRGISNDGFRLLECQREHRYRHGKGSLVVLLPEELQWCVADHEAEVLELRADNEGGSSISMSSVKRALAGYTTTLMVSERLPLSIQHREASSLIPPDRRTSSWSAGEENSILDWPDLIGDRAPASGAFLTAVHRKAQIVYMGELSRGENRFDLPRSIAFALELANTNGWYSTTRLSVTIAKGGRQVNRLYRRDGIEEILQLSGTMVLPTSKVSKIIVATTRLTFHDVETLGDWSKPSASLSQNYGESAECESTDFAGLKGSFRHLPYLPKGVAKKLVLHVALKNIGSGDASLKLLCELPGEYRQSLDMVVLPEEEGVYTFSMEMPSSISQSRWFSSDARFGIEATGETHLRIMTMFLDVETESEAPKLSLDDRFRSLDIAGKNTRVIAPYSRIVVDCTELLLPGEGMAFFDSNDPVVVTMEVLNPPPLPWKTYIRDSGWEITSSAPSSIRPVERLWAKVRGLFCDDQGTASAGLVARDLLLDTRLGALSSLDLDLPSFTSNGVNEGKVASVFLQQHLLGEVMARLLGETNLVLQPGDTGWRLDAMPFLPTVSQPMALMDSVMLPESEDSLEGLCRPTFDGLVYTKSDDVSIVGKSPFESFSGLWLRTPKDGHLRRWKAEFSRGQSMGSRTVCPNGLRYSLGATVSIGEERGELTSFLFNGDSIRLSLNHISSFETEDHIIVLDRTGRRILIVHQGKALMFIDDSGNVYTREGLAEGDHSPTAMDSLALADDSGVRLSAGLTMKSAIFLESTGPIQVSGIVEESATFTETMDTVPAQATGNALMLGIDVGEPPLVKLSLQRLQLRGELLTDQHF